MSTLEEISSEDLGFKLSTDEQGITLFDEAVDISTRGSDDLNLLSIGNINGYFAGSNMSSIVLDKVSSIKNEGSSSILKRIDGLTNVTQLYFNSDETKLFIVENYQLKIIDIEEYFGANVLSASVIKSIIGIELSHVNEIRIIEPSPVSPNMIAVLDKANELFLINNSKLRNVNSNVSAFTWSSDGSTLYYSEASVIKAVSVNGDSLFEIHNTFDDPEEFELGDFEVIKIKELDSNAKWLVVYDRKNAELDDHDVKSFVIEQSKDKSFGTYLADIAPPYGSAVRLATYYISSLTSWIPNESLFFVTSALATDINTLSVKGEEFTKSITQSEDVNRAQFPIDDESGDDMSPVGFAIDLIGTNTIVPEPCNGVQEAKGTLPRLWALTHTGRLIGWWVFDRKGLQNNSVDLNRPLMLLKHKISGECKLGDLTKAAIKSDINIENPFDASKSDLFKSPSLVQTSEKGSAGFGSVGFGSKTSTASSSFGTARFGTASFGTSGFGTTSSTTSGFGQSSFGAVSLTKGPTFGQSSFGTSKPSATQSSGGSSFGNFANAPSGFSSLAKNESPFASLGSKEPKESPFALSSSSSKPRLSFSTPTEQKSPFGQIESTTSKPSEFTSTADDAKSSPFSNLNKIELGVSPSATKTSAFSFGEFSNKDIFSSTKPEPTPMDNEQSTIEKEANDESKKPSVSDLNQRIMPLTKEVDTKVPTGSTKKVIEPTNEHNEASKTLFSGSSLIENTISGSDQQIASGKVIAPGKPEEISFDKDAAFTSGDNKSTSLFGQEPKTHKQEFTTLHKDNEIGGLFGNNLSKDDKISFNDKKSGIFGSQLPELTSHVEKEISHTIVNGQEINENDESEETPHSLLTASETESGEEYDGSINNENDAKLHDYMHSATLDTYSSEYGPSSEASREPASDNEIQEFGIDIFKSKYDLQKKNLFIYTTDRKLGDIDILKQNPRPVVEQFLRFDCSKPSKQVKDTIVSQKINEIYNQTAGYLTVLDKNVQILSKFINDHNTKVLEHYSEETLDYPEFWRLSASEDLTSILNNIKPEVDEFLGTARDQESNLVELTEKIQESQVQKVQVDKLLSLLATFADGAATVSLKNRPLDLQNEVLQKRLRQKLRTIKCLEKELISKMMPLKARATIDDKIIKNIEKVIYQINENIFTHLNNIDDISKEMEGLDIEDKDVKTITYKEEKPTPNASNFSKWNLSKQFTDSNLSPRLISIKGRK